MAKLPTGRHTSSIKEARQNRKKRAANRKMKQVLKEGVKKYKSAIESKDKNAGKTLSEVQSMMDKMAKKNIYHGNKANRLKSRLSALSKKS